MTGIVKWWNDSKGYGFIQSEKDSRDVFAHYVAIQTDGFKTLSEGQAVEFEVVESPKGPEAKNIRKGEV